MSDQVDLDRTVTVLLHELGVDGARRHAADRVAQMLAQGDADGQALWCEILAIIDRQSGEQA